MVGHSDVRKSAWGQEKVFSDSHGSKVSIGQPSQMSFSWILSLVAIVAMMAQPSIRHTLYPVYGTCTKCLCH